MDKLTSMITKLAELLSCHVVVICELDRRGRQSAVGTAFFVSAGTECFLISAAHLFDEQKLTKRLYYFSGPNTPLPVIGQLAPTPAPNDDRDQDRFDIGVLRVPPAHRPPHISARKFCMPVSSLLPSLNPREGRSYFYVGFPISRSKVNPAKGQFLSQPAGHLTHSVAAEQYDALGYDPAHHLLLSYPVRGIGPDGKRKSLPWPKGLSGTPVWLMSGIDEQDDGSQNYVVAIVTEHIESHKILVATDVIVALDLIRGLAAEVGAHIRTD